MTLPRDDILYFNVITVINYSNNIYTFALIIKFNLAHLFPNLLLLLKHSLIRTYIRLTQ